MAMGKGVEASPLVQLAAAAEEEASPYLEAAAVVAEVKPLLEAAAANPSVNLLLKCFSNAYRRKRDRRLSELSDWAFR